MKSEKPKMTYYIIYDVFVSELELRGGDLNVYAAIYSAVAHLGGYISISMICRQTGISRARVYEILQKLEKRGSITRASVGYRNKNKYTLIGVTVGAKGFPLLGCGLSTTLEIGEVAKKTVQNYSGNRRINSTKRLLPKVNNL